MFYLGYTVLVSKYFIISVHALFRWGFDHVDPLPGQQCAHGCGNMCLNHAVFTTIGTNRTQDANCFIQADVTPTGVNVKNRCFGCGSPFCCFIRRIRTEEQCTDFKLPAIPTPYVKSEVARILLPELSRGQFVLPGYREEAAFEFVRGHVTCYICGLSNLRDYGYLIAHYYQQHKRASEEDWLLAVRRYHEGWPTEARDEALAIWTQSQEYDEAQALLAAQRVSEDEQRMKWRRHFLRKLRKELQNLPIGGTRAQIRCQNCFLYGHRKNICNWLLKHPELLGILHTRDLKHHHANSKFLSDFYLTRGKSPEIIIID